MDGRPMISSTGTLKDNLAQVIAAYRAELRNLQERHAEKVVSTVTAGQLLGGLRGVYGLVCDTSSVDPDRGLIVRKIPIAELTERIPEEVLYLLLTGELPGKEALLSLQAELRERARVPDYVFKVLEAMPSGSHP